MEPPKRDKWYFASDFHLGVPNPELSKEREKKIVNWLDYVSKDAEKIFLVGDIFDFWFEYKTVVPKGFVRLQGKIAELSDTGIQIHVFTGNHDMWMFGYLKEELGVEIHYQPIELKHGNLDIFVGHGDGLGPGDKGYKFIKKVFSNRFFQWCFARFHPNFGVGIANYFSRSSRAKTGKDDEVFLGRDKEWLILFCEEKLNEKKYDYFIFGHRHLPLNIKINDLSTYINLGEWINYSTYAVSDGNKIQLLSYPTNEKFITNV